MPDIYIGSYSLAGLTVSSASPSVVDNGGGQVVTITGLFTDAPCAVAVTVDSVDYPCYSGVRGQGNTCRPFPTTLNCVLPMLPVGGPYALKVTQGVATEVLEAAVTVVPKNWYQKVFHFRQMMPKWYKVGPRFLNWEEVEL